MKGFMLSEILQQNTTYFLRYFNEGLHAISALTLTQSKSEQLNTLNKPIQTARSWGSVVAVFPEIVKKKTVLSRKIANFNSPKALWDFLQSWKCYQSISAVGILIGSDLTDSLTDFCDKGSPAKLFLVAVGILSQQGGEVDPIPIF